MYRNVYLHGSLGKKFGECHRLDVNDPAEATRALCQFEGFRSELEEGRYHVVAGDSPDHGLYYTRESLRLGLGDRDLHIVPVIAGSGGRGGAWGYIITGIMLITAAFIAGPAGFTAVLGQTLGMFALNTTIAVGASLILTGTSVLLAKSPNAPGNTTNDEDRKQKFIFGAGGTDVQQGRCVPIVIGTTRVKIIPVSVGLFAEEHA